MRNHNSNIHFIKSALWTILSFSFVLEMVFFPSLENFVGCLVTIVATWVYFRFILHIGVIRRRVISFIVLIYPFLFMLLPLPATLIDGNPISYGMVNPINTFLWQLIYFMCIVFAFRIADKWAVSNKGVSRLLKMCGYYVAPTNAQLWVLGFIGIVFKLVMMRNQYGEETMSGFGTLNMFSIFVYSPICILFRPLMDGTQCSAKMKKLIMAYMISIAMLFIATNSRSAMLSPLIVWALGYLLSKIYERSQRVWFTYKKVIIGMVAMLVIAGPFTDMGFAMVLVRGERSDMDFFHLLSHTFETYMDKDKLKKAKILADAEVKARRGESSMIWNEDYVSNLFLNRLCNYRVADASLYHANLLGSGNEKMREEFGISLMTIFPQPIVNLFFGNIDKRKHAYSSMDYLYYLNTGTGLGTHRVGGDVGLGLATFGLLYFPLLIPVLSILFFLLNSVSMYIKGRPTIPFITLILIYFSFFLRLQVGEGFVSQITYILYEFWYNMFWYLLVYKLVRKFTPSMKKNLRA